MTSNRRAWLTIFAVLILQGSIWGFAIGPFTLWVVPWVHTFHASHARVMAAITLTLVTSGIFSPLVGRLAEWSPVRLLLACGTTLFLLSFILVALAQTMWQILVLYAIPVSLSLVATGPLVGQILAIRLFRDNPAVPVAVASLGFAAGPSALAPIAAFLLTRCEWRLGVSLLTVAIATLAIPLVYFVREGRLPDVKARASEYPSLSRQPAVTGWRILRDRGFIGLMLVVVTSSTFISTIVLNLGPWLADIGIGPERTAVLLALAPLAAAGGMLAIGVLAKRLNPRVLLLLSFLVTSGGFIVATTAPGYSILLLVIPLMEIFAGGAVALTPLILANHFGVLSFPRANGLAFMLHPVSYLGVFLAGVGRDVLGSYPAAFAAISALILPGALGFLLLAFSVDSREGPPCVFRRS